MNISDDATIIATGTEAGKVGDAANQIPGKAVVVDYAKGYNHNNDEKVPVQSASLAAPSRLSREQ